MVVVLAKIKARPEHADTVAGLFREMVEWVSANEESTPTYACSRSVSDRCEFVFFERYTDEAAFHAHSRSARFAELFGQLQGKLAAAPEIVMLEEVAAKL